MLGLKESDFDENYCYYHSRGFDAPHYELPVARKRECLDSNKERVNERESRCERGRELGGERQSGGESEEVR